MKKLLLLLALVCAAAIIAGWNSGGSDGKGSTLRKPVTLADPSRSTLPPIKPIAKEDKPSGPSAYTAYYLATKAIEKLLNDPDSAKFSDRFFAQRKDGLFEVGGVVRAKNAFGGTVRNEWRAVLTQAYVVQYFKVGDHVEGVYFADQGTPAN